MASCFRLICQNRRYSSVLGDVSCLDATHLPLILSDEHVGFTYPGKPFGYAGVPSHQGCIAFSMANHDRNAMALQQVIGKLSLVGAAAPDWCLQPASSHGLAPNTIRNVDSAACTADSYAAGQRLCLGRYPEAMFSDALQSDFHVWRDRQHQDKNDRAGAI